MKKGVLVLGHGSRRQDANEELSKLVGMVQAGLRVRTAHAYFQFAKPSLPDAVDSFVSEGIEEIFYCSSIIISRNTSQRGYSRSPGRTQTQIW